MDDRDLRILQLNCQRSASVMSELGVCMHENRVQVALLQEPYCLGNRVSGLPTGMRVYANRDEPRAAVVVSDPGIDVLCMDGHQSSDLVAVRLCRGPDVMTVASAYFRFGEPLGPSIDALEALVGASRGDPLLIGADANAVHELWFSKRTDGQRANAIRGIELAEWIVGRGLCVLNEPSAAFTFSGPNGESDIDVTVANAECVRLECHWEVKEDWVNSDHNALLVRVSPRASLVGQTPSQRYRLRGVDWDAYEAVLECMVRANEQGFWSLNADERVERVLQWVADANECALKKSAPSVGPAVKWWTRDLAAQRGVVRRMRRKYQAARRHGLESAVVRRQAYVRAMNEYKERMRSAKETHWRAFVAGVGNSDPWGAVYKMCRGKGGAGGISEMKVGDRTATTWHESVSFLMDEFFPAASSERSEPVEMVAPAPLTLDEVQSAVLSLRVRGAPGLDGITVRMLRCVLNVAPEYLLGMYAACVSEGRFPRQWKEARLVILLKGLDKPKSDPRSYRPICLLSVMGKALERVLVNRLNLLTEGRLHERQYGFVKGKSTDDAWEVMKGEVTNSPFKYVLGVFVDFKGAFDNLEWNVVLNKLKELRCMEVNIWDDYFRDRSVCAIGRANVCGRVVQRGCPQGSVCGPAVWNLMMDTLLWALEDKRATFVAYADDLLLLVGGGSRVQLESSANEYLECVRTWGMEVGVEVSGTKTCMMLLKGHLSGARHPSVRVGQSVVKYTTEIKYLGISVGERMSFRPHLLHLRGRLARAVGCMRRVLRRTWGLNERTVRLYYGSLFCACALYGAPAWCSVLRHGYGMKMLSACQRIVLYAILRVCRTVSTDAMQVLAGAPPWDLVAQERSDRFLVKRGLSAGLSLVAGLSVAERSNRVLVHERLMDTWQSRWEECTNGRVTFRWIRHVRFVEENDWFKPSLHLCFVLTGHGSLGVFLRARGLAESELCRCGEPEDWEHVLRCPRYEDLGVIGDMGIISRPDGLDVSGALSCERTYDLLSEFVVKLFARRSAEWQG